MDGNDFLIEAVEENDLDLVREALARGADPNVHLHPESVLNHTSLFWAVNRGNVELVRLLLDHGAKVAAELSCDETSLHRAAEEGHLEILELLLKADGKAALNAYNDLDRTPLMGAVENGHAEAARMLLDAGADVNAHNEPRIGETALKYAVERGDADLVEMLLKAGADPTIPGWMGVAPLDCAYERVPPNVRTPTRDAERIWEMLEAWCERRGLRVEDYLPPADRTKYLSTRKRR
ncbi:MAG: ankyrin repeat domain-containing protein [Armatimonadetes bacterium]|nr:ankyrin repeat domain-containing protein [Armatimonadota bacterium]